MNESIYYIVYIALLTISEEQFAKVDARYSGSEDSLRFGAVEDRFLSLQRQMEERSRAELNMAVCIIV